MLQQLQKGGLGEHVTAGRVLDDERDLPDRRGRGEDLIDSVSRVVDLTGGIEGRLALVGKDREEGAQHHRQDDQYCGDRPGMPVDPFVQAVRLVRNELGFVGAIEFRFGHGTPPVHRSGFPSPTVFGRGWHHSLNAFPGSPEDLGGISY